MPSRPLRPRRILCLLTIGMLTMGTLGLLAGCGDERPTKPASTDAWRPEELPLLNVGSSLMAIAFAGDQGHILGESSGKVSTDYLLLTRDPEKHWLRTQLELPPDNAVLLDLAVGELGLAVGGYLQQDIDPCLIYDERSGGAASIARSGHAIAAVDGDDALMVAGGTAFGGALWASRTPGIWAIETTPMHLTQEGGFTDVFVGGGQALACGFDDGADTLQVVLKLDTAAGVWRKLPLEAGLFSRTLRCIAAATDGTVMVGGLIGGGGLDPRAFLMRRDTSGVWSDIALPDGEMIGGVNDVLPAAGGVWYVACGGEGGVELATIIRVSGNTAVRELTPFHGSVQQLAVDGDGVLHAVGHKLTSGAAFRQPLLLIRD